MVQRAERIEGGDAFDPDPLGAGRVAREAAFAARGRFCQRDDAALDERISAVLGVRDRDGIAEVGVARRQKKEKLARAPDAERIKLLRYCGADAPEPRNVAHSAARM